MITRYTGHQGIRVIIRNSSEPLFENFTSTRFLLYVRDQQNPTRWNYLETYNNNLGGLSAQEKRRILRSWVRSIINNSTELSFENVKVISKTNSYISEMYLTRDNLIESNFEESSDEDDDG